MVSPKLTENVKNQF